MVLELRRLSKRLGGVVVVDAVELQVRDGEVLCLLGPSGCGKTTTLRLIAGFLVPDEGEILLDGGLLSSARTVVPPEKRRMSMLFQSFAVWPHMTVFDNVAYGLRVKRYAKPEIGRLVREALDLVRLRGLESRYPGELSGGQQQRVALARALVVKPQVMLLDEPLSNLDATLREEMRFEIRLLHQELRHTMVYVTHDLGEAMVTADRVAIMDRGRLVQVGTPEEIYEGPRTEFVARFIGKTNILEGALANGNVFQINDHGFGLRIARSRRAAPEGRVKISLRPGDIGMSSHPPGISDPLANVVAGRVSQHVFLGDTRDYIVQVGATGALALRVVRPAPEKYGVGEAVYLSIPGTSCRLLDTDEPRPVADIPQGGEETT